MLSLGVKKTVYFEVECHFSIEEEAGGIVGQGGVPATCSIPLDEYLLRLG